MKERDRFAGFAGISSRLHEKENKVAPAAPTAPDPVEEKKKAARPERAPVEGPMWWRGERRAPDDSFAGLAPERVSQEPDDIPPPSRRTRKPGE